LVSSVAWQLEREADPTLLGLKGRIDQRMIDAEERRKSHERDQERRLESQREKGTAASERCIHAQRHKPTQAH
jgi:hypothetical protein